MANICEFTGAKPKTGHNVSHAQNKTKRTWKPNLQSKRYYIPTLNRMLKLTLTAKAIKTITKRGGIVEALKQANESTLSARLSKIKRSIEQQAEEKTVA
jgi:large subunit ribosomal protein L28